MMDVYGVALIGLAGVLITATGLLFWFCVCWL